MILNHNHLPEEILPIIVKRIPTHFRKKMLIMINNRYKLLYMSNINKLNFNVYMNLNKAQKNLIKKFKKLKSR